MTSSFETTWRRIGLIGALAMAAAAVAAYSWPKLGGTATLAGDVTVLAYLAGCILCLLLRPGGRIIRSVGIYLTLLLYGVVVVYPMVWLLLTSLKSDKDIFQAPFAPPDVAHPHWQNFANLLSQEHFAAYFLNSAVVTTLTVVLTVLLAAMAAYALSRFRFRGARPIFFYFLAGLMIPLQLAIIPLFFEMKSFSLLDSRLGLLIVYVAFGLPFSVFVLAGFFKSLPTSLYESALLDGAGQFRAFWSIMLPLARPSLITVGIFTFLSIWNEFFMAFMFLSGAGSEQLRTLPLGLANVTIVGQYRNDWGLAFAGLVLIMLPTLAVYVLLQRHITKGITVGALKG